MNLQRSTVLVFIIVENGGRRQAVERERKVFLSGIEASVMEDGILKDRPFTGGYEVNGTVV